MSAGKAGFIQQYAGTTAPSGWLECSGQAVSRTDYAELFANIGTTYGVGDGSTTFNLPNGPRRTTLKVDVSSYLDTGTNGFSLTEAYASAEQDATGEWKCSGYLDGTKTLNTTECDIDFDAGTFNFSEGVWALSSYYDHESLGHINAADALRSGSNATNYGAVYLHWDNVPCSAAPAWAAANLDSIPIIKLYDDVADAVSVGVAQATASELGTVKGGEVPGSDGTGAIAAGYVGETMTFDFSYSYSGVNGWKADTGNSMTLTPGVWLVTVQGYLPSANQFNHLRAVLSTDSANSSSNLVGDQAQTTRPASTTLTYGSIFNSLPYVYTISSSTTLYGKFYLEDASTENPTGKAIAIRIA